MSAKPPTQEELEILEFVRVLGNPKTEESKERLNCRFEDSEFQELLNDYDSILTEDDMGVVLGLILENLIKRIGIHSSNQSESKKLSQFNSFDYIWKTELNRFSASTRHAVKVKHTTDDDQIENFDTEITKASREIDGTIEGVIILTKGNMQSLRDELHKLSLDNQFKLIHIEELLSVCEIKDSISYTTDEVTKIVLSDLESSQIIRKSCGHFKTPSINRRNVFGSGDVRQYTSSKESINRIFQKYYSWGGVKPSSHDTDVVALYTKDEGVKYIGRVSNKLSVSEFENRFNENYQDEEWYSENKIFYIFDNIYRLRNPVKYPDINDNKKFSGAIAGFVDTDLEKLRKCQNMVDFLGLEHLIN